MDRDRAEKKFETDGGNRLVRRRRIVAAVAREGALVVRCRQLRRTSRGPLRNQT